MLERLRGPFKRLIAPVARAIVAMGLSADAVTIIGAVGTIIAAIVTGISGWLFVGALVMTLFVVFDSLDGSVAALTTGGTPFGAFLDSTLDRIADWAVLTSVVLYFLLHTSWSSSASSIRGSSLVAWIGILAALYSTMTSFVTSYARARAESVGFEARNGIATRSDRLVIILVGMGVSGIAGQDIILTIAMALLAILGTITVVQRVHEVRSRMAAEHGMAGNAPLVG